MHKTQDKKARFFIESEPEGGFVVRFPDHKGCTSQGTTLQEAIQNANAAFIQWRTARKHDATP